MIKGIVLMLILIIIYIYMLLNIIKSIKKHYKKLIYYISYIFPFIYAVVVPMYYINKASNALINNLIHASTGLKSRSLFYKYLYNYSVPIIFKYNLCIAGMCVLFLIVVTICTVIIIKPYTEHCINFDKYIANQANNIFNYIFFNITIILAVISLVCSLISDNDGGIIILKMLIRFTPLIISLKFLQIVYLRMKLPKFNVSNQYYSWGHIFRRILNHK